MLPNLFARAGSDLSIVQLVLFIMEGLRRLSLSRPFRMGGLIFFGRFDDALQFLRPFRPGEGPRVLAVPLQVPQQVLLDGRTPGARRITLPSMPSTAKDRRHFPTVMAGICSAVAVRWLVHPPAAAVAIRLRRANDCGVEDERTNSLRVSRVSESSCTGSAMRGTAPLYWNSTDNINNYLYDVGPYLKCPR